MSAPRDPGVSYRRISDPKQVLGDGEDRQARDFRSFCERHNLTPVAETFADRRSGYKDEHRRKGRLGVLIAMAKAGSFEPGTVIVIEAWDRLGRLRPDKQTALVAELLACGVRIGVCRLDDIFAEEDFGTHKWTTLAVFIQLAYQESKQKADRVAASWEARRRRARQECKLTSRRLPAWLELDGQGSPVPAPERAAVVKRIFELAAAGYGQKLICRKLADDGVPAFGEVVVRAGRKRSQFSGKWLAPYVSQLLNDRRVLGEHQPRHADGKPAGPVIEGYYPAVVTAEEFLAARQARLGRRTGNGARQRRHVNLFAGLLKHARDGEGFILHNKGSAAELELVYINRTGHGGRGKSYTLPAADFEDAVLALLKELTAADVLPAQAPSRAGELRKELGAVRGQIEEMQDDLKRHGYNPHLAGVVRDLTTREEALANQLQEELARTARGPERSLQELPSLIELRRAATDRQDADLRIAAGLRNLIDEAWLLVIPRGSYRLAALQLFFAGGGRRDYLILHQTAGNHRKGGWWCRSLADVAAPGELDLRQPEHARQLEEVLAGIDLAGITDEPPPR
jgi:DNA invertase Pin-like site-specific DNA recombinase